MSTTKAKAKAKAKTSDEEAEPRFGDAVAYGISTQHQTDFNFEGGGYRSQQAGVGNPTPEPEADGG